MTKIPWPLVRVLILEYFLNSGETDLILDTSGIWNRKQRETKYGNRDRKKNQRTFQLTFEEACLISRDIYRVFKSDWLFVNLYNLKTIGRKFFKFSVYVDSKLRFCYAKSQYWAFRYWRSAWNSLNYHFLCHILFCELFVERLSLTTCHFQKNGLKTLGWVSNDTKVHK